MTCCLDLKLKRNAGRRGVEACDWSIFVDGKKKPEKTVKEGGTVVSEGQRSTNR
jgi:hypothetical protein